METIGAVIVVAIIMLWPLAEEMIPHIIPYSTDLLLVAVFLALLAYSIKCLWKTFHRN